MLVDLTRDCRIDFNDFILGGLGNNMVIFFINSQVNISLVTCLLVFLSTLQLGWGFNETVLVPPTIGRKKTNQANRC